MKKIFLLSLLLFTLLLPSSVHAAVSISVSSSTVPSTIGPGDKANLILTLTNIGTEYARNVKLYIQSSPSITPASTFYDLQSIPNSNSVQVVIPITVSSTATEGTTALSFNLQYNEGSSASTTSIQNSVSISITRRTIIEITNVSYDSDFIQPGDTIKMSVDLKNIGTGTIKDLTMSIGNLTLPIVPLNKDSQIYLGNIEPGKKVTGVFNLIVNKNADTIAYDVPLTLSYYDDLKVLHTEQRSVGLKISGKPEFVVSIDKTENMYSGNTGKISISIANRGTAIAQFLTLKFDSNLYVTPNEYYAGNLDPDDSTTVSLDVNLKGIDVGKRSLSMTLLYKDPYNKDFSESRTLQFDVTNRPVEISGTTQIIIVLAIVVILYWKRSFIKGLIKRK